MKLLTVYKMFKAFGWDGLTTGVRHGPRTLRWVDERRVLAELKPRGDTGRCQGELSCALLDQRGCLEPLAMSMDRYSADIDNIRRPEAPLRRQWPFETRRHRVLRSR
jgi:hypothetical protein